MKRLLIGLMVIGVALFGATGEARAAVDKFTIDDFTTEYVLGRDDEGRSVLTATWWITADFPPNQNHGIAPIFVKDYDGHSTSFKLESVSDETGTALPHEWNGKELRIGDKDRYVEGRQTYVIKYTQRDVTKHYENTGKDEFYWDVIGNEWRVPIKSAKTTLQLSDDLAAARQGGAFCYRGYRGANDRCKEVDNSNEIIFTTSNLAKVQGMTIALGFKNGTFTPYQKSLQETLFEYWLIMQKVATVLAVIMLVWVVIRYYKSTGRSAEMGTIVPEYIPPKNASVLVSANILQRHSTLKGSAMVAQLLDLAVRHYIKIYETRKSSLFRSAQYEIEIIKNLSELRAEEREILSDMFDGSLPKPGSKLKLSKLKNNASYAKRTMDDDKNLKDLMNGEYGMREQRPEHKLTFMRYAKIILVAGVLMLSPAVLVIGLIAWVMSNANSLSDEGLALRRYLAGLKMYISVAEAERLKLLQSPEGAEKTKITDVKDEKKLVKLYEKLLPYAVLFGDEKDWVKQLGKYYEQIGAEPDWYGGSDAFNAAVFAAGMSSLSSSAASVSSYSSSSGGSGGSGYVGGGGGGGGGGGW